MLELLIAIALLGMVVLAITNIDVFSRYHVINSERRSSLQNEISYILEHMAKQLNLAIGNTVIFELNPINETTIGGDYALRVYIDFNQNATAEPHPAAGPQWNDPAYDRWIAYRFDSAAHNITYCPWCTNNACTQCEGGPTWSDSVRLMSNKITDFNYSITGNYLSVNLTGCWDPDGAPFPCATGENPNIHLKTRIKMPAVSAN